MTMNSIRMTSPQLGALKSVLMEDARKESAAIITAGYFKNKQGIHFTARAIMLPSDEDYRERTACRLQMSPLFFNRAIGAAERDDIAIILSHTHPIPNGILHYSASDLVGEHESFATIRRCLGDRPMGSLLFGPDSVIGRVWISDDRVESVGQIRIVDRHIRLKPLGNNPPKQAQVDTKLYDRQIRAFGLDGQRTLSGIKVGIVGVGGTGSAVAEQMAREGVRNFTLIDHDTFSPSNKTRMYGTYAGTKRRPKVEIVGANIRRISPESAVELAEVDIVSQEGLARLKECDVVFSCTDRHRPRSVLNELAHQLFIPVIDVGVGIDSCSGKISGGALRINIVSPSLPCLYCAGVINADRILAESLSPANRGAWMDRGYVEDLADDAPSVVSLTTTAAGLAVFMFKDMLFGISESKACMVMVDIGTLTMQGLSPKSKQGCTCSARMGRGSCMPMSAPRKAGRQ